MATDIGTPRLEYFGQLVLAGILRSHRLPRDCEEMYWNIAGQWRELAEIAHNLPALPPRLGYGIGLRMADGATALEYFCGLVVPGKSRVPEGFACFEIPPLVCAVFRHTEHVSRLRYSVELILGIALPRAGLEPAAPQSAAPEYIQRYGEEFDPETGYGGLDILVPLNEPDAGFIRGAVSGPG